jgi:hypothetical protein
MLLAMQVMGKRAYTDNGTNNRDDINGFFPSISQRNSNGGAN